MQRTKPHKILGIDGSSQRPDTKNNVKDSTRWRMVDVVDGGRPSVTLKPPQTTSTTILFQHEGPRIVEPRQTIKNDLRPLLLPFEIIHSTLQSYFEGSPRPTLQLQLDSSIPTVKPNRLGSQPPNQSPKSATTTMMIEYQLQDQPESQPPSHLPENTDEDDR